MEVVQIDLLDHHCRGEVGGGDPWCELVGVAKFGDVGYGLESGCGRDGRRRCLLCTSEDRIPCIGNASRELAGPSLGPLTLLAS